MHTHLFSYYQMLLELVRDGGYKFKACTRENCLSSALPLPSIRQVVPVLGKLMLAAIMLHEEKRTRLLQENKCDTLVTG